MKALLASYGIIQNWFPIVIMFQQRPAVYMGVCRGASFHRNWYLQLTVLMMLMKHFQNRPGAHSHLYPILLWRNSWWYACSHFITSQRGWLGWESTAKSPGSHRALCDCMTNLNLRFSNPSSTHKAVMFLIKQLSKSREMKPPLQG